MRSDLAEGRLWAARIAHQLRLVQASCAEQPPAQVEEYLAEEIERALRDVAPSNRADFLKALAERFPIWQVAPLPAAPAPSNVQVVPDTPEARLSSLLEILPELSEEQKKTFRIKLRRAGLGMDEPSESPGWTLPAEVGEKLGVEGGRLDPDRAVRLLGVLSELGLNLDQLVWSVWRQLAPKSTIRRAGSSDFRSVTARYVKGEADVSSEQVADVLEQTRRLAAGLLMALGGVGRTFAKRHQSRFSPEIIMDLAEMTKGWAAVEKKAWDKYVELSREFATDEAIEKEIEDAVVRYAEEVMRGRFADPGA